VHGWKWGSGRCCIARNPLHGRSSLARNRQGPLRRSTMTALDSVSAHVAHQLVAVGCRRGFDPDNVLEDDQDRVTGAAGCWINCAYNLGCHCQC